MAEENNCVLEKARRDEGEVERAGLEDPGSNNHEEELGAKENES